MLKPYSSSYAWIVFALPTDAKVGQAAKTRVGSERDSVIGPVQPFSSTSLLSTHLVDSQSEELCKSVDEALTPRVYGELLPGARIGQGRTSHLRGVAVAVLPLVLRNPVCFERTVLCCNQGTFCIT